ncbi:MAG: ATP-binding protein [Pseudomonadota bacterium]
MTGLFDPNEAAASALTRIAEALERLAPPPPPAPDLDAAEAFVWRASAAGDRLDPTPKVSRVDIDLLIGVDRARETLLANTRRFAAGLPANNALLWGARGMGKSSLVKAAHAAVNAERANGTGPLLLVEILREDLPALDRLLDLVRQAPDRRFLLFCDDLSFEKDDAHYKALKAALDGGVAGRPENALLYATSNRRHLMPRDMIENERQAGINPSEATEEKVSLSDRFGLWLGFHSCGQPEFLDMIRRYCDAYGIEIDDDALRAEAIEWRQTRGAMSGRVAWQFVTDLAGRRGVSLANRA